MKKLLSILFILWLLISCDKEKDKPEIVSVLKPISDFVINNNKGLVNIYDSSKNAITFKLDFGDGSPIIEDSIKKIGVYSFHNYKLKETITNYDISYEVFNKIGESNIRVKKVVIPANPKDTIIISPIDTTIAITQNIGYINATGQLEGEFNNQSINYISDNSNLFAGSNFFSDQGNVYLFTAAFTRGLDKCTPIETYTVVISLGRLGVRYLENSPPARRYEILKDSLKIGNKYNFTYTTTQKHSDGLLTNILYISKEKAQLIDIKEIDISPTLYKGVHSKALDVTFILKNSEYKDIINNVPVLLKTDLVFKLRLLTDNRVIAGIESLGIVGFCY